jgi:RimJ/RimL family protein N-acetyltransferase
MAGRTVRLDPLSAATHARDLFEANSADDGSMWTYMPYGPFPSPDAYEAWVVGFEGSSDPEFYAIVELESGRATGVAGYLRISPEAGSIEVGHIAYSPELRRTVAATEAMYLMMQRVFDLGYRRYEWKCDSLNGPSRAAAVRLGFVFEGEFRNAVIYKARNRDTAWYSVIDSEWPERRDAFEAWLDPSNFEQGDQRRSLASFREL